MSQRSWRLGALRREAARWRSIGLIVVIAAAAFALLITANPAHAVDHEAPKIESPYFFIPGGDPDTDRLPLKSTRVDVKLLGPIADVTVTQQYRNVGRKPIEARYVFPGSTGAALYAMQVRIRERVLTAEIREKQAARIEFEHAKKEGRTSALLEQHRPNVFQMNVANILPGDDVLVELKYTELLVPRDGEYAFVFPTVAGPRYNAPTGEARAEKWIAQPFLREGERANHALWIDVALRTPIPVAHVESPSHPLEFAPPDGGPPALWLADGAPNDRDFILRWRLAGDQVQSGVLLYEARTGETENFFLALVEPPRAVEAAAVLPRDYVFVVDISGSMHGFPLDTAKVLMGELLRGLGPGDTFNVLLFSGSSRALAPQSVPATDANVARAIEMLRTTAGGGGTEIVPALKRVASMGKRDGVSQTVVVITDGYVSVEREVFELVRKNLGARNVFAFGIGSAVNRHLIEGIARAGQGEAFVITKPAYARAEAERFRRLIEAPLLTNVALRFEGFDVHDVEPRALPDLLGNRPLVVYGKWKGDLDAARLVVEGRNAEGPVVLELPVAQADASRQTQGLRQLWARSRIAALADAEALNGADTHRAAITSLGLRYGLLTSYTSFVAVDRLVRNAGGAQASVDQPSPPPDGVSNLAVGAELPSTPEPAAWAAVGLMLSALAFSALRRRAGAR